MIALSEAVRRDGPYAMVALRESLSPEFFAELLEEFPSDAEAQSFQNVMGGRRRLASDDLAFYEFLSTRPAWRALYDHINSADFVESVLDLFADDMRTRGCDLQQPVQFDPEFMLRKAHRDARSRQLWRRVLRRMGLWSGSDNDDLPEGSPGDRVFVHFDISVASEGYWREVHRDMDNRIAAFLIYFSDAEECGGSGGEFGVHRLFPAGLKGDLPSQPDPLLVETVELIRPERNMLIMFLSSPDSYHSVPVIRNARASRKFIYVGVSADRPLNWAVPAPAQEVGS